MDATIITIRDWFQHDSWCANITLRVDHRSMTLGEILAPLIDRQKAAGVTQREIALACGWQGGGAKPGGQTRIANYKAGKREPVISDLIKLAHVLGTTATEIVARLEGVDLEKQYGAILKAGRQEFLVSVETARLARQIEDLSDVAKQRVQEEVNNWIVNPAGTREQKGPKPNEKSRRSNRRTVPTSQSKRGRDRDR